MPELKNIVDYINTFAPWELAEEWDNVGLLVNSGRAVKKVLVSLDITHRAVQEAVEKGCDLIVSHHPVIYKPQANTSYKDVVYQLIKNDISAICAHTNWDKSVLGVNAKLASLFGIQSTEPYGYGRVGRLASPLSALEFAMLCKEKFGTKVQVANAGKPVQTIVFVGGSAGRLIKETTLDKNIDCMLVGEAGHHDALDSLYAGMTLVVAGHYETENPSMPVLCAILAEQFSEIEFVLSETGKGPYINL